MTDGTFSPKDPDEAEPFGFDFTARLDAHETIASVTSVDVVRLSGTADPTPNAMKSGAASIGANAAGAAGKVVRQKLTGGVNGAVYEIRVVVATSSGSTLKACGTLSVALC
jgi:hypothetical protein